MGGFQLASGQQRIYGALFTAVLLLQVGAPPFGRLWRRHEHDDMCPDRPACCVVKLVPWRSCRVCKAPLLDFRAEWSAERTEVVALSPLEIAGIALLASTPNTSTPSSIVARTVQWALVPGRAVNGGAGPALDCVAALTSGLGGRGADAKAACAELRAVLQKDALLRAANATALATLWKASLARSATLVQAGATLLCIFVPLGLILDFSVAPLASLALTIYGGRTAGLEIEPGPALVMGVLSVAIVLFAPDPPPRPIIKRKEE